MATNPQTPNSEGDRIAQQVAASGGLHQLDTTAAELGQQVRELDDMIADRRARIEATLSLWQAEREKIIGQPGYSRLREEAQVEELESAHAKSISTCRDLLVLVTSTEASLRKRIDAFSAPSRPNYKPLTPSEEMHVERLLYRFTTRPGEVDGAIANLTSDDPDCAVVLVACRRAIVAGRHATGETKARIDLLQDKLDGRDESRERARQAVELRAEIGAVTRKLNRAHDLVDRAERSQRRIYHGGE